MDNIDDSENNAKILNSDSAYSNSCSNSQSRRSHSSKSTHSGSHSSGSSGYGGKPSTSGSSNAFSQPQKKDKDSKKKKQSQTESNSEVAPAAEEPCGAPEPEPDIVMPLEEPKPKNVDEMPCMAVQPVVVEDMDIATSAPEIPKEEENNMMLEQCGSMHIVTSRPISSSGPDGFSCVISMHDGVVVYTTANLTATLGFPKDMWIGRSFIDFVHPQDRNTFATQITNGLAVPKVINGTQFKAQNTLSESSMICRIRRYRSLGAGFGVKEQPVTFMPFMLKSSFKSIADEDKLTFLVIQATPFFSAFKIPFEPVMSPKHFVIRHSAAGNIEFVDPESVSYLGYLPQDVQDMDVLQLYHDDDLPYLREIYEKIVKEGNVPKCEQYRMRTQNGDYLKLVTEWSSFINPWSMKLEFVVGKHYVIEGPSNPDVFQSPELSKAIKISEEDRNKAQGLRDSIIKIMNEMLTKPAEIAKQGLNKRTHDLAIILENMIAEQPKPDEDFKLDLNEPDHSNYERDSVMLGGISPHHEYIDSKSSTETPLSYNQLNYNENLQRYFDSHPPETFEYNCPHVGGGQESSKGRTTCLSSLSMAQESGDSFDMSSADSSSKSAKIVANTGPTRGQGDYYPVRLTEQILNRHNTEMEKELVKLSRESRPSSKGERDKNSNTKRQKKKEHLARCNASFQPTLAAPPPEIHAPYKPHGTKRTKPLDSEGMKNCPLRKTRRQITASPSNDPQNPPMSTNTFTPNWTNPTRSTDAFLLGVPSHVPLLSPVPAFSGMIPMYYTPAVGQAAVTTTNSAHMRSTSNTQPFQTSMPCIMYGHHVYGQPFVYSPINAQVTYPPRTQQTTVPTVEYANPLSLASRNYEEACKSSLPLPSKPPGVSRENSRAEALVKTAKIDRFEVNTSTSALNRSAAQDRFSEPMNNLKATKSSDENHDRTDRESSYSSFYSSFFTTDSGSAEDSGDRNKRCYSQTASQKPEVKKPLRRKMEPPWMEQVCVTSELVYKYQIRTKSMQEVLQSDKEKMANLHQPALVNEQLEQLYLDLQLEGVAARLTLEEGITSSSSSGEETSPDKLPKQRRKREHSKLVMIYEEDASLPSPHEPVLEDSVLEKCPVTA